RVVLLRHADLAGKRRVAGLGGEPELVVGVLRGRVGGEVPRAVLDALVDRQQHQGAVARAELVKKAVQAGAFAGGKRGEQGFLLGQALQLHCDSSSNKGAAPVWQRNRPWGARSPGI